MYLCPLSVCVCVGFYFIFFSVHSYTSSVCTCINNDANQFHWLITAALRLRPRQRPYESETAHSIRSKIVWTENYIHDIYTIYIRAEIVENHWMRARDTRNSCDFIHLFINKILHATNILIIIIILLLNLAIAARIDRTCSESRFSSPSHSLSRSLSRIDREGDVQTSAWKTFSCIFILDANRSNDCES